MTSFISFFLDPIFLLSFLSQVTFTNLAAKSAFLINQGGSFPAFYPFYVSVTTSKVKNNKSLGGGVFFYTNFFVQHVNFSDCTILVCEKINNAQKKRTENPSKFTKFKPKHSLISFIHHYLILGRCW